MKKQVRNFNPNLVLVIMVILCTIASYFVTPGAYDQRHHPRCRHELP